MKLAERLAILLGEYALKEQKAISDRIVQALDESRKEAFREAATVARGDLRWSTDWKHICYGEEGDDCDCHVRALTEMIAAAIEAL